MALARKAAQSKVLPKDKDRQRRLVNAYANVDRQLKDLEAKKEKLRQRIINEFAMFPSENYIHGTHHSIAVAYCSRRNVDLKALEMDYGEALLLPYTSHCSYERVLLGNRKRN